MVISAYSYKYATLVEIGASLVGRISWPSKFALRFILAALELSYWHFLEPGTNNSGSDEAQKFKTQNSGHLRHHCPALRRHSGFNFIKKTFFLFFTDHLDK
jgi:hypothetical protein